jgi:hypothetical protein
MSKLKEAYRLYKSRGGDALSEDIFSNRITIWLWVIENCGSGKRENSIIRLSEMLEELSAAYLKDPDRYDRFERSLAGILHG